MIKVENLSFSYKETEKVIDNVSFNINKGEFVSILGHNGSGKSTLAKLLVGLLRPDSGEILINGQPLTDENIDEIRKKIGIVFQNPDNQFVGVTVRDDIAFGMENRMFPRDKMLELIDYYAEKVRMGKFLHYNPENLSGGEKQRVAIAGVLAINPDIIIFDEATSMLDPKGVKEVNEIIWQLKREKTLITITHNLNEAIYSDRVMVMNEGKIVLNDSPENVFRQRDLLLECKLDIVESMKLLDLVEKNEKLSSKQEIEELLWELTFRK
ncbi:MAG: energy-coupling factor transporter ATPase [Bacilli bacterium]|jgi:energy-coupling factor transport system ATP-binding protein|nr:energy-coupling factor transporter ATPase [Bacillota bacterium]NLM31980.1 energy-coupling factor transporter ATPase [Acholeplasmataceae bacterium]HOA77945.1 energy-coupling factor transporter ATPase [Bacilli bacterium]HPZ26743.1 energy-coupling factor transporter ATPase [Bacilli bacterium]HQC89212.1 energy-coupling factor transporter ATPase [Bacilli bacterium]